MTLATVVTKRYRWRRATAGSRLGLVGSAIADQVLGRYLTTPVVVAPVPLEHPTRRLSTELRLSCRFSWQTTLWLTSGRGGGERRAAGGTGQSAESVARAVRGELVGGARTLRTDPAPGKPQPDRPGALAAGGDRLALITWLSAGHRLPDAPASHPGMARPAGAVPPAGTSFRPHTRSDAGQAADTAAAAGRGTDGVPAAVTAGEQLGSTVWRRPSGAVLATAAAGTGAATHLPGRAPSAVGDKPPPPRWLLPLVWRRIPGISSGWGPAPSTAGALPTASGRAAVRAPAEAGAARSREPEPVPLVMAERSSVPAGRGERADGGGRGTTAGPAREKTVAAVPAAIPGSTAAEVAGVTKALAQVDLNRLTDEVCRQIERRLLSERERRGR